MSLGGGYMLSSRKGTQIPAIGLNITMKANGPATRDAYSLFEYAIPPETNGPPPHIHQLGRIAVGHVRAGQVGVRIERDPTGLVVLVDAHLPDGHRVGITQATHPSHGLRSIC